MFQTPEYDEMDRKVTRVIRFVDTQDISQIEVKGKHVLLRYSTIQDKIKVMIHEADKVIARYKYMYVR